MTGRGHNERSFRLDTLADDARKALKAVEEGEAATIEGWLAYGAALNEGRSLFPGDKEFWRWIRSSNLEEDIHPADQSAAMWAAANADQLDEARAASSARTLRGLHAKWKEIEAEREAEQRRQEAEARKAAEPEPKAEVDPAPYAEKAPPEEADTPDPQPEPAERQPTDGDEQPEPRERQPKPVDPHRVGLSGLTREGLEDEVAGLRAENSDLREKLAKVETERDRFKDANRDLSQPNQGATISRLKSQILAMKYARDEAMSATKREEYKRKKAEKELARIMGQEIEL